MDLVNVVCVILAGGKGKRMGSEELHKVCFPIGGVPAINRTLAMFKSVGIRRFLVVVGAKAEQVISTIAADHPDVAYAYQREARGTGHAVACALDVLKAADFDGKVLITMGDKVIQPQVVRQLIDAHETSGAVMTLAALPKSAESSAGRIVLDSSGRPLGNVEVPDLRRARERKQMIKLAGKRLSADAIERRSTSVNASLYLYDAKALYDAVAALESNNAQGELYLTDTLEGIAAAGKTVRVLDVPNPDDLMAYNTPEELLKIEEVYARKTAGRPRIVADITRLGEEQHHSVRQWQRLFDQDNGRVRQALTEIYGDDVNLLAERREAILAVLKEAAARWGPERRMVLVRAPGRINLMGRHVDHRGGYVNIMAISREVILAAAPRNDDSVTLHNLRQEDFPDRQFQIGQLLRAADWFEWMDYISSATVRQALNSTRGDWSNYAKAAVLRLQHACRDYRLRGMDCIFSGNIPMGAGLSSSSAMVVAIAEAAVAINGLDLTTRQFVDLCGEGEWFVGSRGGSADHAAIRSGQRGHVARVGFFPFRIESTIPWPDSLSLVVANSHLKAAKSEGAKDTFNQRVACYKIAEMLLRKTSPMLRSMQHLRDVDPDALGVSPAEIYRAVQRLPLELNRRQIHEILPEQRQELERIFSTHSDIGPYRLRDVTLYGISECQRSRLFGPMLADGRLEEISSLLRVSHDGDRVVQFEGRKARPFKPLYGDVQLTRLIADAASSNPGRRQAAALWAQPGRYACSTPEIDLIVDSACACEGVIGAQVAGAGLGGCAMIVTYTDAVQRLLAALRKAYYAPRKLPFDVHVCRPVSGSGLLRL